MQIDFTMTVDSVDPQNEIMVMRYERKNGSTHLISMRMPDVKQDTVAYFRSFAPLQIWATEEGVAETVSQDEPQIKRRVLPVGFKFSSTSIIEDARPNEATSSPVPTIVLTPIQG